jgi:hypothetical protein
MEAAGVASLGASLLNSFKHNHRCQRRFLERRFEQLIGNIADFFNVVARVIKQRHRSDLVEIVGRSTGHQVLMQADGRTS